MEKPDIMEAMIFMMIFGAALLLAAGLLALTKDPKNSILMARVRGLEKMSHEEALKIAHKIAGGVAIVGAALIVFFGILLFVFSRFGA